MARYPRQGIGIAVLLSLPVDYIKIIFLYPLQPIGHLALWFPKIPQPCHDPSLIETDVQVGKASNAVGITLQLKAHGKLHNIASRV